MRGPTDRTATMPYSIARAIGHRCLGGDSLMERDVMPGARNTWTLPDYVHERELGSGAVGRVVLARHEQTGTPVAIKYLVRALRTDQDFRTAYRHEAELLGELRSGHVARLYEYVEG